MDLWFLAPATLFVSIAIVLRGPLGKALATRIAGRGGGDDATVAELRARLDDVVGRLAEVEERMDFAERLLAKDRDAARLRPDS